MEPDSRAAGGPASVEFDLTPEEWVEVSLEHHERQPMNREAVRRLRLLFGALVVVIAALITLSGAAGSATLIWLLGGGAALTVFGPLVRTGQRRQLRRFADMGIANGTFGRHCIELRPEGMLDSTEAYERLTRWPSIERVEQGENAFLVYVGPNAFLPIPHSAFPDSESLRRFSDAFYALKSSKEGAGRLGSPRSPEPGLQP